MKNLKEFIDKLAGLNEPVLFENGVATFVGGTSFSLKDALKPAYILVQQGGSSSEFYVHAWNTVEDAEQDRINCRDDGSYETSPVVVVPAVVAAMGEAFYEVADALVDATAEIGYPD